MMLERLRVFRASQGGAAAVEFAFVCSVLFTLILGIFNLGWALYCGADARHAVERASRIYLASPNATYTQFRNRFTSYLEVAPAANVSTTVTRESVAGGAASIVRVSWTYNYVLSIPFVQASTFNFGGQVLVPLAVT